MALEAVHAHAEAQIHAVVPMNLGAHRAHLGAQDAAQRHRQGFDHRDLQAPLPRGGGHFSADEPGPHHRHPLRRRVKLGPDGQAVVEAPQGVDAVQSTGGQLPAAGPGGDEDALGAYLAAVIEGHGAGRSVEPDGSAS